MTGVAVHSSAGGCFDRCGSSCDVARVAAHGRQANSSALPKGTGRIRTSTSAIACLRRTTPKGPRTITARRPRTASARSCSRPRRLPTAAGGRCQDALHRSGQQPRPGPRSQASAPVRRSQSRARTVLREKEGKPPDLAATGVGIGSAAAIVGVKRSGSPPMREPRARHNPGANGAEPIIFGDICETAICL